MDRSGLPGKFKAWIYQHGILPRILWPLLVYEVPISTVETLERKVSTSLRRRLGLPRSLSNIALYGNTTKLRLPLVFGRGVPGDSDTRGADVQRLKRSKGGPGRSGGEDRKEVECQGCCAGCRGTLRHKDLVGVVAHGRAGLDMFPKPPRHKECKGK